MINGSEQQVFWPVSTSVTTAEAPDQHTRLHHDFSTGGGQPEPEESTTNQLRFWGGGLEYTTEAFAFESLPEPQPWIPLEPAGAPPLPSATFTGPVDIQAATTLLHHDSAIQEPWLPWTGPAYGQTAMTDHSGFTPAPPAPLPTASITWPAWGDGEVAVSEPAVMMTTTSVPTTTAVITTAATTTTATATATATAAGEDSGRPMLSESEDSDDLEYGRYKRRRRFTFLEITENMSEGERQRRRDHNDATAVSRKDDLRRRNRNSARRKRRRELLRLEQITEERDMLRARVAAYAGGEVVAGTEIGTESGAQAQVQAPHHHHHLHQQQKAGPELESELQPEPEPDPWLTLEPWLVPEPEQEPEPETGAGARARAMSDRHDGYGDDDDDDGALSGQETGLEHERARLRAEVDRLTARNCELEIAVVDLSRLVDSADARAHALAQDYDAVRAAVARLRPREGAAGGGAEEQRPPASSVADRQD